MKKLFGMILILVAIIGIYTTNVSKKEQTAQTTETLATANSVLGARVEDVVDTTAETEIEIEVVEEVAPFEWVNTTEKGTILGKITIDSVGIECAVSFGGSTKADIDGVAGVHEDISNENHLFILGHNYAKSQTLFHFLPQVEVDDEVTIETIYGTYTFKVVSSEYVTAEQYAEGNYEICQQNDLVLATCDYRGSETGRHIVVCELV